jgi:hypothetical protein
MSRDSKGWNEDSPDWVAMVTTHAMMQFVNDDGTVTATPEQLAERADLPIEVIDRGLNELSRPDSQGFARITRLRDLSGWQLANLYRGE